MRPNQGRLQRDYELSCAGYFISLITVIKLTIPCNLIALPTHTALPCAALRPLHPHLVGPVEFLGLRAELRTIWLVF